MLYYPFIHRLSDGFVTFVGWRAEFIRAVRIKPIRFNLQTGGPNGYHDVFGRAVRIRSSTRIGATNDPPKSVRKSPSKSGGFVDFRDEYCPPSMR